MATITSTQGKRRLSPKQQAFLFFLKQAGYSVAQGETTRQGRARSARELAKAERDAREYDLMFEWIDDVEGCNGCDCGSVECDCFTGESHEVYGCRVWDGDGNELASLWGICKPSNEYRRVVEAELAQEAIAAMAANGVAEVPR